MEFTEERNSLQALSFDELIGQKLAIEAELDQRADVELAALKERLEIIATYKGLELSEILQPKKRQKQNKASARYQHPENPSLTWSGRGKPPTWMQQLLDEGADKEAFALA